MGRAKHLTFNISLNFFKIMYVRKSIIDFGGGVYVCMICMYVCICRVGGRVFI